MLLLQIDMHLPLTGLGDDSIISSVGEGVRKTEDVRGNKYLLFSAKAMNIIKQILIRKWIKRIYLRLFGAVQAVAMNIVYYFITN